MSKIYLASALTHIPRQLFTDYCENLHKLAKLLESSGHVVKYALKDSDPQLFEKPAAQRPELCYLWDKRLVEEAEYVVAETSFASLGLGIELQIAANNLIPIILLYKDYSVNRADGVTYKNPDGTIHDLQIGDGKISLMALGLPNIISKFYYDSIENIYPDILGQVSNSKADIIYIFNDETS